MLVREEVKTTFPAGDPIAGSRKVIPSFTRRSVASFKPMRIGTYGDAVFYSTLMPCYLCTGAAVKFGIKKVVVKANRGILPVRGRL
jgi:hypothetical protein